MNPALADTLGGAAHAAGPALFDAAGSALRVVGALAAVLVVIFVLSRLARRYGPGLARTEADRIDLVTERRMGQRVSLAIVRVAARNLLVSVSPQGVALVAELGAPNPKETVAPRVAKDSEIERILDAARRVGEERSRPQERAAESTFESELKGRLATLKERYPSLWEVEGTIRGGR